MRFGGFDRNCGAKTLVAVFWKNLNFSFFIRRPFFCCQRFLFVVQRRGPFSSHQVRACSDFLDSWLYDRAFNSSSTDQKNLYEGKQIFSKRIERGGYMGFP